MTTTTQPADLLALVAKWRERANYMLRAAQLMADPAPASREAEKINAFADELQAAIKSLAAHRGEVEPPTDSFVQDVPDRCDRIVWRDKYYHLRENHPPQAQAGAGDALARIGELIRTQDNRITDQPIFIVQQKRRICGMDEEYADDFMWYDASAVESYDEAGKDERDADREAEGLPPIEWQRGGYIDIWEFVTACFTEQGCKDYIARDGHNLREPRIYAAGSFRNEEFRTVRKYLAALEASHEPE